MKSRLAADKRITFYAYHGNGGHPTKRVARNTFVIRYGEQALLVDPGHHNGNNGAAKIDGLTGIIVTHAHSDHCGSLPEFMRLNPDVPVFCHPTTQFLIVNHPRWRDPVLQKQISRFTPIHYGNEQYPASEVAVRLLPAGHILGSAACDIRLGDDHFLFTGDCSAQVRGVLQPFAIPDREFRAIIADGDFVGRPRPNFGQEMEKLFGQVQSVLGKPAPLLICVDSIGASLEYAVLLARAMRESRLAEGTIHCLDLKNDGAGEEGFLPSTLLHGFFEHYPSLEIDFRRVMGKDGSKTLASYFAGSFPFGPRLPDEYLHGKIIILNPGNFRQARVGNFNLKEYGRAVIMRGGAVLTSRQYELPNLPARLGIKKTDFPDSWLCPPSFDHPYQDTLTVLSGQAKTTLLVHGDGLALSRLARQLGPNVIAPDSHVEVPL